MPLALGMPNCPNLAVPAEVMQHVVNVESGYNPFAIGVVGGRLERQPQNLDEAVATVHMLETLGYNFSLGIAQVNRYNLAKYGLDTYEKAFDACPNLEAGTRILAQCYAQSGGDWGKSFSCYYSGNFTKGYDDGYVQKVYDSINRSVSSYALPAHAIPLKLTQGPATKALTAEQLRVNMRSSAIDAVGTALVKGLVQSRISSEAAPAAPVFAMPSPMVSTAMIPTTVPPSTMAPSFTPSSPMAMAQVTSPTAAEAPISAGPQTMAAAPSSNDVFTPQVRGPNDGSLQQAQTQADVPAQPASDQADLRLRGRDDAFVF
jgi:type IV secretion system protein VirB1